MLLSTGIYTCPRTCPKLEVLAILDECIAPSLCTLRDQSKQCYSNLVFTYCNSLHKLNNLGQAIRDIETTYNTPMVTTQTIKIHELFNKIDMTIKGFSTLEPLSFNGLCSELEEMREKLLALLVSLNNWGTND